jgi:MFS family permease
MSERVTATRPDDPIPDDASASPVAEPVAGTSMFATVAIVSIAALIVSLTQSLLVPVLPQIAESLHASTGSVEWLLTSTLLVGAVAVPVIGRLADLFGKKLMIIVTLVVLIGSSLLCALTSNVALLITGRAIMGLCIAAIPLGISLVSSVLPAHRSSLGIALISAMLGIGGSLGLPLAGLIAQHADFHVLFWVMLGAGVVALVGMVLFVPEAPITGKGRLDLVGTVLLSATLVALLLPLAESGSWGWGDPKTYGLLIASAVLLVIFVLVELRIASPLVDVVVNARPALLLTNVASTCVGFALFASAIGTSSYMQAPKATGYGFGLDVLDSSLCLVPSGVAMLLLSPVSASISNRFGPKITLALGSLVVGLGFVSRIFLYDHVWEILVGTTLAGAGIGIAYAAMPGLILRATPMSELAAANGLNSLFRSVGTSLASAVGGAILASQVMRLGSAELPSLHGYKVLFLICTAAAVLGAVVSLLIPPANVHEVTPDT